MEPRMVCRKKGLNQKAASKKESSTWSSIALRQRPHPTSPFGSGRVQALQDYVIGPSLTVVQQPELSGGSLGGLCPGSAWEVSPPPGRAEPSQSPTIATKGNYPESFAGLTEAWGPGRLRKGSRCRQGR